MTSVNVSACNSINKMYYITYLPIFNFVLIIIYCNAAMRDFNLMYKSHPPRWENILIWSHFFVQHTPAKRYYTIIILSIITHLQSNIISLELYPRALKKFKINHLRCTNKSDLTFCIVGLEEKSNNLLKNFFGSIENYCMPSGSTLHVDEIKNPHRQICHINFQKVTFLA